jgi:hypothetical protein
LQILCFGGIVFCKKLLLLFSKITTISYNMKRCFTFFYFKFF